MTVRKEVIGDATQEPDYCSSCIGTGIGWFGPSSACSACNGRGVIRPKPNSDEEPCPAPVDEEWEEHGF